MDYRLARMIAVSAHAGQKRKDGEDYINHAFRVADMCRFMEVTKIIGVLHDTVEDTDVTLDHLKGQGATEEVLLAIDLLTHKKGTSYLDYILSIKNNDYAKLVKLADLSDNLNGATGTLKDKYEMARYILTR